nr:hypothetical protein [uncultured Mediterranean phage uvMED]
MGRMLEEGDQLTLRIFTLLLVNSFLIGSAVAMHAQGLFFPNEGNWTAVGVQWMMAAVTVQMVGFMLYKVFFQERLEDQSYIQNLMYQTRRNTKMMNAELQKFTIGLEMEQKQREMERIMSQMQGQTPTTVDNPPVPENPQISLAPDVRNNLR